MLATGCDGAVTFFNAELPYAQLLNVTSIRAIEEKDWCCFNSSLFRRLA